MLGRMVSVVLVFTLGGCAGGAPAVEVTESQAYDLVESYVRRAATALPAATLEPAAPATSTPCVDEPGARVANSYWLRGISSADEHFDAMLGWWTEHGFELLDDLRPERHYVWVTNPTDAFRMSLRDNEEGELLLGAESPCVRSG